MKHTYLALIFIILLSACGSRNNKKEIILDSHLSSTKIIAVLTDLQLLESLISTHRYFRDKEEQNLLLQKILDKHQISRQELDSVLIYLESDLEVYQEILDSVKINLEGMKEIDLQFLQEMETPGEIEPPSANPIKLK